MNNNQPRTRARRSRVSTKHKVIVAVILVLYTAILTTVTYFLLHKPQSDDRQFIEYVTDEEGNTIEITHDFEAVSGSYNILLLGQDKEAMLTDVIMIMNINNNNGSVTVMQIPRDTYVKSTDGVSIITNKANELFVDHFNYYRNVKGEGENKAYMHALETMAELLSDSLCINIDFAAIMDLKGFKNIVNAIGGVEMDVPADMEYYDPVQDLTIRIPAGHQTLNGDMAEGFVRFRYGYVQGDLGRVNAQKQFVIAFFNKLKSSISITNVSTITNLAKEVFDNIETNLGIDDIVYFGRSALSLDMGNIRMLTMPGNVNYSHYVMNKAKTLEAINAYFNTFDREITSAVFDSKGQFNNPSDPSVSNIYNGEKLFDDNIYTGEDDIDVPRT
ncbi:MAG: LCP family protein [Clostridia bacterium]|nr:LCP family protein [Clostridia bacterium]